MKPNDRCHKWVEWSDKDLVCICRCPDLVTGIHGDDPIQLYDELCTVVDEVIAHFQSINKPLPPARTRLTQTAGVCRP